MLVKMSERVPIVVRVLAADVRADVTSAPERDGIVFRLRDVECERLADLIDAAGESGRCRLDVLAAPVAWPRAPSLRASRAECASAAS